MADISKKNKIKIPKDISVFYCNKKQIITFIGPVTKKSLKIKVRIFVKELDKIILVSKLPFTNSSNNEKKKFKMLQGTTVALIKHVLIETSTVLYQKLKFIGVGYRTFPVEHLKSELLNFKLGYSHQIYFKIPSNLKVVCHKLTKLFIYGSSYTQITQTAALIRSYKCPEPYKGKGILFENEKIKLKEGKKI